MTVRRPRRARQRRQGLAAVEFALVAFPFFAMMFAVMELGAIFVIGSVLENATVEASRLVRTGQADTQNMTEAQFKTALCNEMSVFAGDCQARAEVDVRVVPDFRDANTPDPLAGGVMNPDALDYDPGAPGTLMVVQVFYTQPLITPVMSQALARLNSGETVIRVATAFRNEPYPAP